MPVPGETVMESKPLVENLWIWQVCVRWYFGTWSSLQNSQTVPFYKGGRYLPCLQKKESVGNGTFQLLYFHQIHWNEAPHSAHAGCVSVQHVGQKVLFSQAAVWAAKLVQWKRQRDVPFLFSVIMLLLCYYMFTHIFMCVSILLPGIDQQWHTAWVRGYCEAGFDKQDTTGIASESAF